MKKFTLALLISTSLLPLAMHAVEKEALTDNLTKTQIILKRRDCPKGKRLRRFPKKSIELDETPRALMAKRESILGCLQVDLPTPPEPIAFLPKKNYPTPLDIAAVVSYAHPHTTVRRSHRISQPRPMSVTKNRI